MSAGSGSPSVAHTLTGPAGGLGAEITRTGLKPWPTVHRSPHTSELTPRRVKWGDRAHLVGLGEDPESWHMEFRAPSWLPIMGGSVSFVLDYQRR